MIYLYLIRGHYFSLSPYVPFSFAHSQSFPPSLSLSLTLSLALSLSLSLPLSLSHTLSLSLYFSLSHSISHSLTHSRSLSLSPSLSLSLLGSWRISTQLPKALLIVSISQHWIRHRGLWIHSTNHQLSFLLLQPPRKLLGRYRSIYVIYLFILSHRFEWRTYSDQIVLFLFFLESRSRSLP